MTIPKLLMASTIGVSAISAGAAYADCGEVTITEMSWASSQVVSSVATFLMTSGYGCDVTAFPSDPNPALTSVAETGQPDILTEIWTNSAPALAGMIADGSISVVANVLSDGGVGGWYVPRYLVEEHPELATVEGLAANPELIGGLLNNCPDGWTCKNTNTNLLRALGLGEDEVENFIHGSGDTLAASMAAAYSSREPWVGYYWEPTALLGRLDMVRIDMGGFDAERYACLQQEDCAEPMVSDYPTTDVVTIVTEEFQESNPEITELMRNISFTNAQMGDVLAWQQDNGASSEEAAVYFLTTYPDVWSTWISEEARENLAALLQ